MARTESEALFEQFCDSRRIAWKRVEVGAVRTPDYDIYLDNRRVIVEVKEITPNAAERQAQKQLKDRGFSVTRIVPGDRARKKISDAAPQIKARTENKEPSLLVLFHGSAFAKHIDPYQIRAAMFGFETVQFVVPKDPREAPYPVSRKFGAKRKMTADHNTSISAVASFRRRSEGELELTIFHNPYAAVPLDRELPTRYGIQQFRLGKAEEGAVPQWEEA